MTEENKKEKAWRELGQRISRKMQPIGELGRFGLRVKMPLVEGVNNQFALMIMRININWYENITKPMRAKGLLREPTDPAKWDIELTKHIANSFIKNKLNHWYPYTMPTREDVQQEAYIAYLEAEKDYSPAKGDLRSYYFNAVQKYLFKKVEEANAIKRKSESDNKRLEYKPEYTEGYTAADTDIYQKGYSDQERDREKLAIAEGVTLDIKQRYDSREYFNHDDEQEYKEPDRVERRESEAGYFGFGGQLFIDADHLKTRAIAEKRRRADKYKQVEIIGCPLGYGPRQEVIRAESYNDFLKDYPGASIADVNRFNEYRIGSSVMQNRRRWLSKRGNVLIGQQVFNNSAVVDRCFDDEQMESTGPRGYSYKIISFKEKYRLPGIAWDNKRKMFLKEYLTGEAGRTRDSKRQFSIDDYKVMNFTLQEVIKAGFNSCPNVKSNAKEVTYISITNTKSGNKFKYKAVEIMKTARQIYDPYAEESILNYLGPLKSFNNNSIIKLYNHLQPESNFNELYREAWRIINTFPDQQRQLFELFYAENEYIFKTLYKQKTLFDSLKISVHDDRKITESQYTLRENIKLKYTLKDIAKLLNIRYMNVLTLHNQGIDELKLFFDNNVNGETGTLRKHIP